MTKRRRFTADFNAKVALEVLRVGPPQCTDVSQLSQLTETQP